MTQPPSRGATPQSARRWELLVRVARSYFYEARAIIARY
jgi:hypothetical protein